MTYILYQFGRIIKAYESVQCNVRGGGFRIQHRAVIVSTRVVHRLELSLADAHRVLVEQDVVRIVKSDCFHVS